jgi:hypothetical protein
MRTTLTIDDDLSNSIEKYRESNGLKFRETINQLLRAGLESKSKPVTSKPFKGPVSNSKLLPGIDPNHLNRLVDELEIEDYLQKHK